MIAIALTIWQAILGGTTGTALGPDSVVAPVDGAFFGPRYFGNRYFGGRYFG